MPAYQMLTFYLPGGGIVRGQKFEAETDEAVIAHVENIRGLAKTELWRDGRKVKEWDTFSPVHQA